MESVATSKSSQTASSVGSEDFQNPPCDINPGRETTRAPVPFLSPEATSIRLNRASTLVKEGESKEKVKLKVLLAEDEPRVQSFIKKGLEQVGMTVDTCETVEELESALMTGSYDALVLDRLLRTEDSVHFIPHIKRKFPHQKILVLSALSEVVERIRGLEHGADDYLGKPFHIEELVARLRSLGRRSAADDAQAQSGAIEILDLKIDLKAQRVTRAEVPVDLTSKEFRLLVTLCSEPKRVFTRAELLQKVWDFNFDPESNVVDVAVGRLKRKINAASTQPFIHAKRGVGYSLLAHEAS